jgi:CRAL/TRIO domain
MEESETKAIPIEAYRYWPKDEQIYTGSGKSIVRYIFYKVNFTEFEIELILTFKNFIKNKSPDFVLPSFFCEEELLRIVLGCKFDMNKSYTALINSINWRNVYLVNSYNSILPFCKDLLNSGCIYFHGRDHRYRPLLVLNISKLDLKKHTTESYSYLLCFLLEYAVQKLMIPGQIENWVVITDLNGVGLTKLPISEIRSIIKVLQDNFRCRMIVNYILNAPSSLFFIWSVVKKFIEEHTIKKIKIIKESVANEMKNHFSRTQYEKKYGGLAPNATNFWPPCFPGAPFEVEGEAPDKYLTDIDTYNEYNAKMASEISSEMGEVSENISIHLPNSLTDHLCSNYNESHSNLTAINESKVNESVEIERSCSPEILENLENESNESEIGINYEQSSPNPPDFDSEVVEKQKTRPVKFCNFCSNKKCGLF